MKYKGLTHKEHCFFWLCEKKLDELQKIIVVHGKRSFRIYYYIIAIALGSRPLIMAVFISCIVFSFYICTNLSIQTQI